MISPLYPILSAACLGAASYAANTYVKNSEGMTLSNTVLIVTITFIAHSLLGTAGFWFSLALTGWLITGTLSDAGKAQQRTSQAAARALW